MYAQDEFNLKSRINRITWMKYLVLGLRLSIIYRSPGPLGLGRPVVIITLSVMDPPWI